MTYRVQLSKRASRELDSLERKEQQRVRAALDLVAENPRPPRCVAMSGYQSTYRVRVGDYRIVYEVRDNELFVFVINIGHRRSIYR